MTWGRNNTYDELPMFRTYKEAWEYLTTTVPIRGRAEETIPLGARRYADDFSIGTPKGQPREYGVPIELRMHGKPCITFGVRNVGEQETTHITLASPWNYWAVGVVKFISSTVRGLTSAFTKRGVLVLQYASASALSVEKGRSATFCVWDDKPVFLPEQPKVLTTLRLNRVETNNVRKRYGGFYRYLKGMLKLRNVKETSAFKFETEGVLFTLPELQLALPSTAFIPAKNHFRMSAAAVGQTLHTLMRVAHDTVSLSRKPAKVSQRRVYSDQAQGVEVLTDSTAWGNWTAATTEYLALISPPDNGTDKTADYAKALARLAVEVLLVDAIPFSPEGVYIKGSTINALADEVLFKIFSDEVFEVVEMEAGKVPSFKYDKWITREVE